MEILRGLLIAVELVVSLLLILIILVQPSKSGGGLGGAAFGGGGMGEQLFGARAGNVLTKGTVLLSIVFLVNTLVLAKLFSLSGSSAPAPTPAPAPGQVTEEVQQPAMPEVPAAAAADSMADLEASVAIPESPVVETPDVEIPSPVPAGE